MAAVRARTVRAVYHAESKRVSLFFQFADGVWAVGDNVPRFVASRESAPAVQWSSKLFGRSDLLAIARELLRVAGELPESEGDDV